MINVDSYNFTPHCYLLLLSLLLLYGVLATAIFSIALLSTPFATIVSSSGTSTSAAAAAAADCDAVVIACNGGYW